MILTSDNVVSGSGGGAVFTTSAELRALLSDPTGTGLAVFNTSPTLVTPLLGTPTSGVLTNCTGLPVGSITGLGTGISTFLATPSSANLLAAITNPTGTGLAVFATSPTLTTPILGTPTSGNLVNCTGFTVANLAGLGTGVGTFLATPSSTNLISAVTDETGTGSLVFATSPTLVTPVLGVAGATKLTITEAVGASALVLTGATQTLSFPVISATQTWNDGSVTFTGIFLNVTNTASASGSLLIDSQVGAASKFKVDRAGNATFAGSVTSQATGLTAASSSQIRWNNSSIMTAPSDGIIRFQNANSTSFTMLQLYTDTGIGRNAAGVVEINNSTAGTFADLKLANLTSSGVITNSLNGAASVSAGIFTGTIFTGGSATTTKPLVLIEPTGTTSTGWSTSGTGLGINAPAAFAGRGIDYQVNGVTQFNVSNTDGRVATNGSITGAAITGSGNVTAGASNAFILSGRSAITSASDGVLKLSNNAGSDFTRLQFGGTTSSFPALTRSGTLLQVKLADDSTFTDIEARNIFSAGDNAGLASTVGLSNVTDTTLTNAYVVKGGQAATTANTGWIKIYVGTVVSWIPYWSNATP